MDYKHYCLGFNKEHRQANWVYYELGATNLTGKASRKNDFRVDPKISRWSATPDDYKRSGYDRGHLCPAADMSFNAKAMSETFYMSNMTPQLNRLNQDMWAKLEAKVRVNKCSDTLYVVTGAYFGSNATTTFDGAGNTVAVPTNYYKVLLRTKTGSTGKAIQDCTDDELISIGFWVEQKSYGNIEPPRSICTTVADIEQKTGFTFFPKVSATVKKQNNPTQWGIN